MALSVTLSSRCCAPALHPSEPGRPQAGNAYHAGDGEVGPRDASSSRADWAGPLRPALPVAGISSGVPQLKNVRAVDAWQAAVR